MRIVRVYPRLLVGGAEQHILQLLEGIPGTEMVVPGVEGPAAVAARRLAGRYQFISSPRLAPLVSALRGADIVHIHTVNNEPLLPLAVQLAGPRRIALTVHNNFEADYALIADHSFVVGIETAGMLAAPSRVSLLPEGVAVPPSLPPWTPWVGRPLRLVEVRRDDKAMAFTLEDLIASGALYGVDFEARIVGVDGPSSDPRVTRVGAVEDPAPHIAWADLLVHGSAAETFGRTVYEAMACGVLPLATPLPAFTERLTDGEHVLIAEGMRLEDGIALVRRALGVLSNAPAVRRHRAARYDWVRENASVGRMVQAQKAGYSALLARPAAPRSVLPADVPDPLLPAFGALAERIVRGQPVDSAEVDALPPRPRALALWMLVSCGRVPPELHVRLLRGCVSILGPRPTLALALGNSARQQGDMDLAAAAFEQVRALDPALVSPHLELADLHIRGGRPDDARAALRTLIETNPGYAPATRYLEALSRGPRRSAGPFAHLKRFARIIVTGPHRSGTTVATEMIAADTGFEAVREEAFDFYDEARLRLLMRRRQVVVQCPALFDLMPALSDPETAIVLMRRPLVELAASRGRMFAPGNGIQLSPEEQNTEQLARLGESDGDAAALKYERWASWRAGGAIHHPVEVDYSDLADHPMWVSPEKRRRLGKRWHNRRTRL